MEGVYPRRGASKRIGRISPGEPFVANQRRVLPFRLARERSAGRGSVNVPRLESRRGIEELHEHLHEQLSPS